MATEGRVLSEGFFFGDDIASTFFERAINDLQEDKKSLVNDMFKRTDADNFTDYMQSLEEKANTYRTQIDYYRNESNNQNLTEADREIAKQKENSFRNDLIALERQRDSYYDNYGSFNEESNTNTMSYNSYDRVRYSFDNKQEYDAFASAMLNQNVYINTSSAEVNGGYVLEMFKCDQEKAEIFANNQNFRMENKTEFYSETPQSYFSKGNGERTDKGNLYDNYGTEGLAMNSYSNLMKDTIMSDADMNPASHLMNKVDQVGHFFNTAVDTAEAFKNNGDAYIIKDGQSVLINKTDLEMMKNGATVTIGDNSYTIKDVKFSERMPEYLKINNQLSKDTMSMVKAFGKNNPNEGTLDFLKELDKKYGTNLAINGLSPKDMININSKFIEKHKDLAINSKGKVDFEKLSKLSDTQLKALGISAKERDFIVSSHKALSANGQVNHQIMMGWNMKVIANIKKTFQQAGVESDEDLESAKRTTKQTFEGGKRIYEKEKDYARILKEKRERRGIKKATGHNKKATSHTKKVASKTFKAPEKNLTEEMAKRASRNYRRQMINKMGEKYAFAQRLQATAMTIKAKVGESLIGKVASTVFTVVSDFITGTLIPCVGIAGALFSVVVIAICIIIICVTGVTSLFDATTNTSVVALLAEVLTNEETAWYEHLKDTNKLWEDREGMYYDDTYMSFDAYIGANNDNSARTKVKYLYRTNDGNMYIIPWLNHSVNIKEYGKDITGIGFDGGYTLEVDTNWNLARSTTTDANGNEIPDTPMDGYWDSKSGHTSNIKDIICMADVMFGFDQDGATNESMQSITGTMWDMNWTHFTETVKRDTKFVGATVSQFWDNDAWVEINDGTRTTSYGALQSYCMGLFEASHQEKIKWEVVFLPMTEGEPIIYGEDDSYLRNNENISLNGDLKEVCPDADKGGCMEQNLYCFATKSGADITYGGIGFLSTDGYYYGGQSNCVTPITVDEPQKKCIPASYEGQPFYADWNTYNMVSNSDCWVSSGDMTYGNEYYGVENPDDYNFPEYALEMSGDREGSNSTLSFVHYWWVGREDGIYDHTVNCIYWEKKGHTGLALLGCDGTDTDSCPVIETGFDCSDDCKAGQVRYVYDLHYEVFTHQCQGHKCHLCGGHLVANIHGFVYSMTDEQWFSFSGEGVGSDYEIVGKILPENINYASGDLNQIANAGQNTLETYVGGLNLNNVGGSWGSENKYMRNRLMLAQDIFDIDLAILYGKGQFPIASYTAYEGWTADNMTFAVAKASADWEDYYGFDIPTNMGTNTLSEKDVANLVRYITLTYEAYDIPLSEERIKAIEVALQSVGKGNYSQLHHGHAYRSMLCHGHECNKTDCSGFASYCINASKGTNICYTTDTFLSCGSIGDFGSCFINHTVLPGDVLIKADGTKHAIMYIGFIDFEKIDEKGVSDTPIIVNSDLETSLGSVGQKMAITVDCTTLDGYGNIYMRNCFTDNSYPAMNNLDSTRVIPYGNIN